MRQFENQHLIQCKKHASVPLQAPLLFQRMSIRPDCSCNTLLFLLVLQSTSVKLEQLITFPSTEISFKQSHNSIPKKLHRTQNYFSSPLPPAPSQSEAKPCTCSSKEQIRKRGAQFQACVIWNPWKRNNLHFSALILSQPLTTGKGINQNKKIISFLCQLGTRKKTRACL